MLISTKNDLKKAAAIIRCGGVIVYPTDTAYALGGFFDSQKTIKKIMKIKGRKDEKFTLIASSLNQVQKYFKLNALEKKLAKKYWPGPLSLAVTPKFAVRVPNNKVALALARCAGRPLIATSANLSGNKTPYSVTEVIKEFEGREFQPDLIIGKGKLKKIKTSTIVKAKNEKIELIRPGAIKI